MINITFQIHQRKKDESPHHFAISFKSGDYYIYYLLSARFHFRRLFFIIQVFFDLWLDTSVAHYFHRLLLMIIQGIFDYSFTTLLFVLYPHGHIKIEADLSWSIVIICHKKTPFFASSIIFVELCQPMCMING